MIFRSPWRGRRGVALVIVLAFVVLLTGLIIAFFSRSLLDRQISNSSASQAKVSAFADGAADAIIGELKQEIVLSSSATAMTSGTAGTLTSGTLYTPLAAALTGSSAGMLPQMTGLNGLAWAPAPNLLKISGSGQLFYSGTNVSGSAVTIPLSGVSNVIAVSSTIPSLNGRYISPARWNAHYLLPLLSSTDSTPVMTGTGAFIPPSWVLVARDGSNPAPTTLSSAMTASGSNPIVGRYAFAIYHEGGLLDANVAGYPSTTGSNQFGYKPALAYADLTQIGLTSSQIDQLVAWRNYASAQAPGSFASPGFTTASGSNYYTNVVVSNSTGFLSVSGSVYNGQTDQMFASRQELIKFVQSGLGISGTGLNVLNYLTHFTRDLNQPSINPNPLLPKIVAGIGTKTATPPYSDYPGGNNGYGYDTPNGGTINPPFLSQAIGASTLPWTRNDGTPAVAGEPLVKKRFALDRLAWITCKGPISTGTFVGTATTAAQVSGTDPVLLNIAQTLHNSYGLSYPFLSLGTATNIRNYFGLVWQTISAYSNLIAPNYWIYAPGAYGTALAATPVQGHIDNPNQITNREPNFIELLKAAIHAGALGKSAGNLCSPSYPYESTAQNLRNYIVLKDSSIDCQVMQIAANIIEQAGLDAFPKRIIFDDGSQAPTANPRLFTSVENLPYLYTTLNVPIYARKPNIMGSGAISTSNFFGGYPVTGQSASALTDQGAGALLIVPEIWNPHDQTGMIAGGIPAGGATTLRPNSTQNNGLYLRIVADNTDPATALFGPANTTPVSSLDIDPPKTGVSSNPGPPTNPNGANILDPSSSELDFGDSNGQLFREPTALISPGIPSGSLLQTGTGHWLRTDPLLKSTGATGYLTDFRLTTLLPAYANFLGIYMGSFPLAQYAGPATSGTVSYYGFNSGGPCYEVYHNEPELTFRMQCKDAYNNWIDYDVKGWANIDSGQNRYAGTWYDVGTGLQQLVGSTSNNKNSGTSQVLDPRTDRFGMQLAYDNKWVPVQSLDPNGNAVAYNTWAQNSNVVGTKLPLYNKLQGTGFSPNGAAHIPLWSVSPSGTVMQSAGFTGGADYGLYSQNKPVDALGSADYYTDADGIERYGMAAYWSSKNVGLPTSTASGTTWATGPTTPIAQSQSRPLILHRPFKNVAELGYVFSDTPWKNLDFFTPQSGNNGLLDLFCTHDSTSTNPLVAGILNLNTRQPLVLQAVLSGAYRDETSNFASPPTYGLPALTVLESGSIAAALVARTTGTEGELTNIGDLVGIPLASGSTSVAYDGLTSDLTNIFNYFYNAGTAYSVVQRMREAAIRPLAQVGSTRVWNLMIDVVAQTGRYPLNATSAANPLAAFLVEGEQHYWIHVAIDRATGQVLDKQVEVVRE